MSRRSLLSLAFIPVCLSILGAAPFMSKRENLRLLRWRVESLSLFIIVAAALTRSLSVAALFWGLTASRSYLCARFFFALRHLRTGGNQALPRPACVAGLTSQGPND
jgi:hypothetical protein